MFDEYKMLREEIMDNITKTHSYVFMSYTTIIALLVLFMGLDKINPNYFIVIFMVILSSSFRVKRLLIANVKISTYMEIFLEPNINIKWETRSHERDCDKNNVHSLNYGHKVVDILFYRSTSIYIFMGLISFILYITLFCDQFNNVSNVIGLILNILMLILLIYNSVFDANDLGRDKYVEHWKKIKNR